MLMTCDSHSKFRTTDKSPVMQIIYRLYGIEYVLHFTCLYDSSLMIGVLWILVIKSGKVAQKHGRSRGTED